MRSLVRENLALVVGIALPIVVVTVFALVNAVPGWLTAPPEHDLLVVYNGSVARQRTSIEVGVADSRVRARLVHADDERAPVRNVRDLPRLFRFIAESGEVIEIELSLPADADDLASGTELALPELAGQQISTVLTAPDGYVFRGGQTRSSGPFGGLFGVGMSADDVLIEKDGATLSVPLPVTPRYSGQVRFLGWIVG